MTFEYRKAIDMALTRCNGQAKAVTLLDIEDYPNSAPITSGVVFWIPHFNNAFSAPYEFHAQRWIWHTDTAEALLLEDDHVSGTFYYVAEAYTGMGGLA